MQGQEVFCRAERAISSITSEMKKKNAAYKTTGIYLQCDPSVKDVCMVAHGEVKEGDIKRADRHVFRRLLTPQDSIAARSYFSDCEIDGPSHMFPDQHYCIHVHHIDDLGRKWVIQYVVDPEAPVNRDDITSSFFDIPQSRELIDSLSKLYFDVDRARLPYKQNAVLLFIDMNGSKEMARKHGYNRHEDFAHKFRHEWLGPMAKRFNGQVVRFEGDGLWVAFPFDDNNKHFQIVNAHHISERIRNDYHKFVEKTDYKYEGTTLKIGMELGELLSYQITARQGATEGQYFIETGGDAFIAISELLSGAPRDAFSIQKGNDLIEYLDIMGVPQIDLSLAPKKI